MAYSILFALVTLAAGVVAAAARPVTEGKPDFVSMVPEGPAWKPNPDAKGFQFSVKHRDHVNSPMKRTFKSKAEKYATWAREDMARYIYLGEKARGALLKNSHEGGRPINGVHPGPHRRLLAGSGNYNQTLHNGVNTLGNYYVDMYFGTPAKHQTLVFDTGSDLIWVQCECQSCYPQQDPIYNPSASSTYAEIPCDSNLCLTEEVQSSYYDPNCYYSSTVQCPYNYGYGSGQTTGLLATETISLTQSNGATFKLPNTIFGCGQNNQGFSVVDGLLGMGRTYLSLPNQLSAQGDFDNIFSSCLIEEDQTKTSTVTYGPQSVPASGVTYTPLLTNSADAVPAFYYVQIKSVSVGGSAISVPASAFALSSQGGGGTIFDTGTTFGILTSSFWTPLFNAVEAKATVPLSTPAKGNPFTPCWSLAGKGVTTEIGIDKYFPSITINFNGASVTYSPYQYIIEYSTNIYCNALESSTSPGNILGGILQQNTLLVWDRANTRLGFKPLNCTSGTTPKP